MNPGHRNWLVAALVVLAMLYAWTFRFAEDDAFITFRYSAHLAQGHGPVWNLDQRVEGYSNFLWMCLMAVPLALGMDPVTPAALLGILFLGGNLWLLSRLAIRAGGTEHGFWFWLPLLSNQTLLLFAGSGLETAMNGFLWTLAFWQLLRLLEARERLRPTHYIGLGTALALSVLSRPEGLLLVAGVAITWLAAAPAGERLRGFAWTLGSLALVCLPPLLWKIGYYGFVLPNTYYIKGGAGTFLDGLKYGLLFWVGSALWIPVTLIALRMRQNHAHVAPAWRFALVLGITFWALTVYSGGDYLEFRLLTPVSPLLTLGVLHVAKGQGYAGKAIVFICLLMSAILWTWGLGHGKFFHIANMRPAAHLESPRADFMSFSAQGRALGELLDHDGTVRLAIGASGAIPYYSKIYAIDLYGLNEPHQAFESRATGFGPGHAAISTYAYLNSRAPHLVSLRCSHTAELAADRRYTLNDPQIQEIFGMEANALPEGLRVVEFPLGGEFVEVCLYWRPHPRIDHLLKNNRLKIFELQKL